MKIITISREFGSGGRELGHLRPRCCGGPESGPGSIAPAVKKPHWERRTARRRCFRLRARLSAHPACSLGGFWNFRLINITIRATGAGVSEHYWK